MSRPASPPTRTRVLDVRKGDTVLILTGKDASKRGTVERIVRPDRVVVEGLNVAKRHTKPRQTSSKADRMPKVQTGGILDVALPIDVSTVMLVCPKRALERGAS